MVEGLAGVVQEIGRTNGCSAAKQLARSVGQTFAVTDATSTLLPIFVAALDQSDPTLSKCVGLAQAAKQLPAKGWKGRFVDRAGGVGLGRVKRPVFCKGECSYGWLWLRMHTLLPVVPWGCCVSCCILLLLPHGCDCHCACGGDYRSCPHAQGQLHGRDHRTGCLP